LVFGGAGREEEEEEEEEPGENREGVDAPSQHTILRYVDIYMQSRVNIYAPPTVLLSRVAITTLPLHTRRGGCRISFVLFNGAGQPVYDYGKANGWLDLSSAFRPPDYVNGSWNLHVGLLGLKGDVCFRFYLFDNECSQIRGIVGRVLAGAKQIDYAGVRGRLVFFLTTHTSMLSAHVSALAESTFMTSHVAGPAVYTGSMPGAEDMGGVQNGVSREVKADDGADDEEEEVASFSKSQIDGASDDVECVNFQESFRVSLFFTRSFQQVSSCVELL
jgi:hypothetical protein